MGSFGQIDLVRSASGSFTERLSPPRTASRGCGAPLYGSYVDHVQVRPCPTLTLVKPRVRGGAKEAGPSHKLLNHSQGILAAATAGIPAPLSVTTTTSTTLALADGPGPSPAAIQWRVRAAASLTILLFALTPITTQLAGAQIPGVTIGVLRVVGSGLFAFPLLLLCRVPIPAETESWTLVLVSALGSFAGFPLLFSIGVRLTSASHAGLIMATMPLITSILGLLMERRRPGLNWFAGTTLAFAGEALLVSNGDATSGTIVGDAIVFIACVLCACGFAAGGRLAQRIDPLAATLWAIAVASLGFLPAAVLMVGTVDWTALTSLTWAALLHITLGASVLAYMSWFWALSRGGIARVAAFQFAQPALVFIFAAIILREHLPAQLLVATLVVFGGIALARRG